MIFFITLGPGMCSAEPLETIVTRISAQDEEEQGE